MKIFERIKLIHRATKYKNKNDRGGIAYLLASLREGETALDVGAHKAGYLYWMAKQVGATGKVYAFEPQSRLYAYLKKINPLFKKYDITIEHIALSNTTGATILYIPENTTSRDSSPGATIVPEKARRDVGMLEETIETETLDSYCRKNDIVPDFIKIDVEGNELNVLKGGTATLTQHKPRILIEIEARHVGEKQVLETFRFLESMGYKGHFIRGTERVDLALFDFDQHQNIESDNFYCNNFTFE